MKDVTVHSDMCVCSKVDPGNTGRVGPTEAALFLKKSGLPDITLGKVGSSKTYTLYFLWCQSNITQSWRGTVYLLHSAVGCSL